jgi:hypothetical protein
MKAVLALFLIIFLAGCATTKVGPVDRFSLLPENTPIHMQDLSPMDMAYLDKSQFLVQVEAAKGKDSGGKRVGLIFTTETMHQQPISITSINLKSWLVKGLKTQGYFFERTNPQTQAVILVEYGVEEINNPIYQQQFHKKLYNRYLNLRALNYPAYRESRAQKVLWEVRLSSLGPESDMNKILPVLSALVPEVVNQSVTQNLLVAPGDPRLELTKEVPTAISVEEFKPTVEELKVFN